jgi:hypothetical protein
MEFPGCKVKSVKADIANGELTISFGMTLNDDSLAAAEALGLYVDKDAGKVEVRVIPNQPPLFGNIDTATDDEEETAAVPSDRTL